VEALPLEVILFTSNGTFKSIAENIFKNFSTCEDDEAY
ncbi:unnamed protein product, partial [Acidithrix sp. C25]